VIIPPPLRECALKLLPRGHPGIRRLLNPGRLLYFWPRIDNDIERIVKQCFRCAETAAVTCKEPLNQWPDTKKPWSRVHMDFGEPKKGHAFLVVVDSFSRYADAEWITPVSTAVTVKYLRRIFRHLGVPETIVTDNGTQFTSTEFASLCTEFDIVYLRSPPRMLQCNGLAERMVQTIKNGLDDKQNRLDLVVACI